MSRPPFLSRLREEWQRLNPRFMIKGDPLHRSLLSGMREGFHCY
jgi:hypothetical protein